MWEAPLKAPRADGSKSAENVKLHVYERCNKEIRKALARNLTIMQRYCLWRANNITPATSRMIQIAGAFSMLPLLETPYHIVGQTHAIQQVIDVVASHYLFVSGSPLVLLFTGASGHGMTDVARRMGDLLALDIHVTDCTMMKHETDIFGAKAPYEG